MLGHCARTPALIRGFLRIQRPSLLLLLGEHGLLRRKHGLLSLLSLLSLLNCGGVELGRQRLRQLDRQRRPHRQRRVSAPNDGVRHRFTRF